jgi:hypothetical protein
MLPALRGGNLTRPHDRSKAAGNLDLAAIAALPSTKHMLTQTGRIEGCACPRMNGSPLPIKSKSL